MIHICKFCGHEYKSYLKTSNFCSIKCRQSYYRTDKGKEEIRQRLFLYRKQHDLKCNDILLTKTCLECQQEFQTYDNSKKFCCRHCSALYNGKHSKNRKTPLEIKRKISQSVKQWHINHGNIPKCRICGSEKGKCKYPKICKFLSTTTTNSILVKFGFDTNKLNSLDIYNEFYKIRQLCYTLYCNDKLSLPQICQKYNISSPSALLHTFDIFGINRRSKSTSLHNAISSGRFIVTFHGIPKATTNHNIYKNGWHVTWDNYRVYYRSSYELDMCNELDKQRIHYNMENLQLPYYHIIENKVKTAIPDFYIPSKNLIIEVKSDFTYCRSDMISRFKSYKQHGYDYKLILEHKDFGKKLPKTKNAFYDYLKTYNPKIIDDYKMKDI